MNEPASHSPRTTRTVDIFGLGFEDVFLEEAAEHLVASALVGRRRFACFVNAHCVNVAARCPRYAAILSRADLRYADGAGMALAARLWGRRLRDNVNGTDLFPHLCRVAARRRVAIGLLGGRPGVADACARRMLAAIPGLAITFTGHGYHGRAHEPGLVRDINRSGTRLLLVAMGVPAQEAWMARNHAGLEVPVIIGVGALLDFYSGRIPRAPRLLRQLRMEWLFRLGLEPRRMFHRYVMGNPAFLARAISARLRGDA